LCAVVPGGHDVGVDVDVAGHSPTLPAGGAVGPQAAWTNAHTRIGVATDA
jgi:hypothetical protein